MADDVQQMIDDCNSTKNIPRARGGPGFTDWELEFLESIEEWYSERDLTEKQRETLKNIWDKI